jgi:hypothetical protein
LVPSKLGQEGGEVANSRGSAKEKNGEKHCAVDNRGGRRRGGMDVGKLEASGEHADGANHAVASDGGDSAVV